LDYAIATVSPEFIRLTVAKFNLRALKLYKKFGFELKDEFVEQSSAVNYCILVRAARVSV
jgi:ribosomal protein S18 acetylase RimI-like enzyme